MEWKWEHAPPQPQGPRKLSWVTTIKAEYWELESRELWLFVYTCLLLNRTLFGSSPRYPTEEEKFYHTLKLTDQQVAISQNVLPVAGSRRLVPGVCLRELSSPLWHGQLSGLAGITRWDTHERTPALVCLGSCPVGYVKGQRDPHGRLEVNAGFPGTIEGPTSGAGNICSSVKRTMEPGPHGDNLWNKLQCHPRQKESTLRSTLSSCHSNEWETSLRQYKFKSDPSCPSLSRCSLSLLWT